MGESSSRTFTNKNRCHAVTYFFYRINKCQSLVFELVGIERRVDDPAAPTGISLNLPGPVSTVGVIPAPCWPRRSAARVERQDRTNLAERETAEMGVAGRSAVCARRRPSPLR